MDDLVYHKHDDGLVYNNDLIYHQENNDLKYQQHNNDLVYQQHDDELVYQDRKAITETEFLAAALQPGVLQTSKSSTSFIWLM